MNQRNVNIAIISVITLILTSALLLFTAPAAYAYADIVHEDDAVSILTTDTKEYTKDNITTLTSEIDEAYTGTHNSEELPLVDKNTDINDINVLNTDTDVDGSSLYNDAVSLDYDFSPIAPTQSSTPAALRFDRIDFGEAQSYADDIYKNLQFICSFDDMSTSIHRDELYDFSDDEDINSTNGFSISSTIGDIGRTQNVNVERTNYILVGKYNVGDTTDKQWTIGSTKSNITSVIAECVAECVRADYPDLTFDLLIDRGWFTTFILREAERDGIIGVAMQTCYLSAYGWRYAVRDEDVWTNQEQIEQAHDKLVNSVEEVVSSTKNISDDYDKISFINDWLIDHNSYADTTYGSLVHSAVSALTDVGSPVCQGYAEAFLVLSRAIGIPCATVIGNTSGGERHEWNVVQILGKWFLVDTTWSDTLYEKSGKETDRKRYFLLSINGDNGEHIGIDDKWGHGWLNNGAINILSICFDNYPPIEELSYWYWYVDNLNQTTIIEVPISSIENVNDMNMIYFANSSDNMSTYRGMDFVNDKKRSPINIHVNDELDDDDNDDSSLLARTNVLSDNREHENIVSGMSKQNTTEVFSLDFVALIVILGILLLVTILMANRRIKFNTETKNKGKEHEAC